MKCPKCEAQIRAWKAEFEITGAFLEDVHAMPWKSH